MGVSVATCIVVSTPAGLLRYLRDKSALTKSNGQMRKHLAILIYNKIHAAISVAIACLHILQLAGRSIRFLGKNKRRAGHYRRTGADERDVYVFHLARASAARGLQRAFDDMPQAVDAPGAE